MSPYPRTRCLDSKPNPQPSPRAPAKPQPFLPFHCPQSSRGQTHGRPHSCYVFRENRRICPHGGALLSAQAPLHPRPTRFHPFTRSKKAWTKKLLEGTPPPQSIPRQDAHFMSAAHRLKLSAAKKHLLSLIKLRKATGPILWHATLLHKKNPAPKSRPNNNVNT